jgi:hypothetical protein
MLVAVPPPGRMSMPQIVIWQSRGGAPMFPMPRTVALVRIGRFTVEYLEMFGGSRGP